MFRCCAGLPCRCCHIWISHSTYGSTYYYFFIPSVVKIPRVKSYKKLLLLLLFFFFLSRGSLKIKINDVLGMTISPCSQRPANCYAVKLRWNAAPALNISGRESSSLLLLNREQRGIGRLKFGTEVAHVIYDSDTSFKVKRSCQLAGGGGGTYCGGLAHSLLSENLNPTFT